MYRPKRWSIFLANVALVVQTIAPVLFAPTRVSAADPVSFSAPTSRYIKDTAVGANRLAIVATDAEHDQVKLTATGPVTFSTTLATYSGTTIRSFYFYANTPGVPAPLTAGEYSLTAEAWNTTTLAWDAATNTGNLYVLDTPTTTFNPAASGTVSGDLQNPMTFIADDEYNQAASFYVRVYNQSNVLLATYTPVPRSICDLTNAGTTVSCDVNDISGWQPIGATWGTGNYYITVRPTDPSGNVYTFTTSPTFTVDATTPTTTVTAPADSSITNSPIAINGFSLDNIAVQQVNLDYALTGTGSWSPITTITNPGPTASFSWMQTWTPPSDGSYDIRVITTDGVGNQDVGDVVTNVTYDTGTPTLTETTPVTEYTNDTTPSVVVNSSEDGDLSVVSGGCGVTPSPLPVLAGDNTVTFDSLVDGTYNCALNVVDAATNTSTTLNLSTFTVDTVSPSSTLSPADNFSTRNSIVISGTATDNQRVASVNIESSLDNGLTWNPITLTPLTPSSPTASYGWSYTWNPGGTAASGTYDIRVTTLDAAGNSWSGQINDVLYDRTLPGSTISTPANNSSFTSTFNASGTATDVHSGVASVVLNFTDAYSAVTTFNLPVGTPWLQTITTSDLTDGIYSMRLTVTDLVGNVRNLTRSNITFDNAAPDALSITSHATGLYRAVNWPANITGVATDATSGVATVDISYSTDSGLTWTPIGSASYSNPNWSIGWLPADGTYDIRAIATDNLGLTSTVIVTGVTLDTVAPTVTETSPVTLALSNNPTPSVTVTTDEDGTLNWVGGACTTSGVSSLSAGSTTLTFDALGEGTYSCTLTVTDAAGNVSAPLTLTGFQIDLTNPTATWTEAPGGAVRGAFSLNGTATDDFSSVVAVSLNLTRGLNPPIVFTPTGLTTWSFTASTNPLDPNYVADGTYDVTLTVTDAAGNVANDSMPRGQIVVDNQSPAVTWTSPTDLGLYNGTLAISGTAVDNGAADEQSGINQVTVDYRQTGNPAWTNLGTPTVTAGVWSTTFTPATSGLYEFRVNGADESGNTATEQVITITYDRDAPATLITSPSDGVFVNHPITISGQSTDNIKLATVQLYASPANLDSWSLITTLTSSLTSYDWSSPPWTPAEGTYDLKAVATDAAGNVESTDYAYDVTYDVTPPAVTNFRIIKNGLTVSEIAPGDTVTLKVDINDAYGVKTIGTALENPDNGKVLTNVTLTLVSGTTYQASFVTPSTYLDGTALSSGNRWAVGVTDQAGNTISRWSDFKITPTSSSTTTATSTSGGSTGTGTGTGGSAGTGSTTTSTTEETTTELAAPSTETNSNTSGNTGTNTATNSNQEVAGASTERDSFWSSWWFWLTIVLIGGGAYYYIWWMRPEGDQS